MGKVLNQREVGLQSPKRQPACPVSVSSPPQAGRGGVRRPQFFLSRERKAAGEHRRGKISGLDGRPSPRLSQSAPAVLCIWVREKAVYDFPEVNPGASRLRCPVQPRQAVPARAMRSSGLGTPQERLKLSEGLTCARPRV